MDDLDNLLASDTDAPDFEDRLRDLLMEQPQILVSLLREGRQMRENNEQQEQTCHYKQSNNP